MSQSKLSCRRCVNQAKIYNISKKLLSSVEVVATGSLHVVGTHLFTVFAIVKTDRPTRGCWNNTSQNYRGRALNSIECITHAGYSIAFCIFWPSDLDLWSFEFWPNIHWWARYRDGLSLWQVWWLYFHPFWFYRAKRQTESQTHRQNCTETPVIALLMRQSAWVNKDQSWNPLLFLDDPRAKWSC